MLAIQMTCCLPLQRTPLASSGFLNRSGAGRSVKSSELHRLRGIDAKYDLCHTQQRVESSVQSLTGEEGGWLRLQLQLRLQVKLAGISASVSVSVCARKKARMCAAANGRRGKERHWWFLHLPLLLHLLLLLLCETPQDALCLLLFFSMSHKTIKKRIMQDINDNIKHKSNLLS